VLVLVVANEATPAVLGAIAALPAVPGAEAEVLLIVDRAKGQNRAMPPSALGPAGPRMTILSNPVHQGYGGNQKLGFHYAIENGFDFVVVLPVDGPPLGESLPPLLAPLLRGEADFVLGSRILGRRRAPSRLPLARVAGIKMLTWVQNRLLRCHLSEYDAGAKAAAVTLLCRLPFELNSSAFHFDTELIIQCRRAQARIAEVAVTPGARPPPGRGHGLGYISDALRAAVAARLQDFGLVYRRNFDVAGDENQHYVAKLHFLSTHSAAVAEVPPNATVLDVGCGPGHLCAPLHAKGCRLIGVDQFMPKGAAENFDEFHVSDLNTRPFPHPLDDVQVLLVLDIIEHLISPEKFCAELRERAQANLGLKIVISTGNIGFVVTRLMLFLGQFNYNKRGILDLTHTRLFTFSSLRRLLQEAGFVVEKEIGIPAPVPLVVQSPFGQKVLMSIQAALIHVSRGLFAYQMFLVVKPRPTLRTLVQAAQEPGIPAFAAAEGPRQRA
jgi:2-polyprenyl-3-methyl-5-hydroxy-6-metoxy-1,4-benzoquinol methylase